MTTQSWVRLCIPSGSQKEVGPERVAKVPQQVGGMLEQNAVLLGPELVPPETVSEKKQG